MRTLTVVAVLALGGLARSVSADELPLGVWTGFVINPNNQNRPAARLEIKKVPDPHVLWRGGSGEITSAVYQFQNQNNQFEVGSISLADGRLTFSFSDPRDQGDTQTCVLTLQPKEGTYVGDCLNRRLTLTPPAPPAAKPADAAKPPDAAK